MPTSPSQTRSSTTRANAPRIDVVAANAPRTGYTAASPMSLDSPMTHGFKRKADGAENGTGEAAQGSVGPSSAHKRNKSMDIHGITRIGEVRSQVLESGLQNANVHAAFRTAEDASFLRHGQGAKRLGEAIA
jgi:hypothetical protein